MYLNKIDFRSHPYRMRPETNGFSYGLKKCPPDTFLHQCTHWCRPFESILGLSPRRSVDCYAESGEFLRKFVESDEPIEKLIIGALGDYDTLTTPRSAGSKAGVNVLRGWTPEMEDEFRYRLLHTDRDDLLRAAELLERAADAPGVCIIGPASALDSCADLLKARLEL